MTEPHTPTEGAPSAEEVQEHVQQSSQELNLGAGNDEPDPATAGDPPEELMAGDKKREKEPSPGTAASSGVD